MEYYPAFIPGGLNDAPQEPFDTAYMNKLFAKAFELAKSVYSWRKVPPVVVTPLAAGRPTTRPTPLPSPASSYRLFS